MRRSSIKLWAGFFLVILSACGQQRLAPQKERIRLAPGYYLGSQASDPMVTVSPDGENVDVLDWYGPKAVSLAAQLNTSTEVKMTHYRARLEFEASGQELILHKQGEYFSPTGDWVPVDTKTSLWKQDTAALVIRLGELYHNEISRKVPPPDAENQKTFKSYLLRTVGREIPEAYRKLPGAK